MGLKPTNPKFSYYNDLKIIEIAENIIYNKNTYPGIYVSRKSLLEEITARFNNLLFNIKKEEIISNFETNEMNKSSDNISGIEKMSNEELLKNAAYWVKELALKHGKSNKFFTELLCRFNENIFENQKPRTEPTSGPESSVKSYETKSEIDGNLVMYYYTPVLEELGITEEKGMIDDMPKIFAITECSKARAGIMIYGFYRNQWIPNPSTNYLIRHLFEKMIQKKLPTVGCSIHKFELEYNKSEK